jgi:hypothetical protein
MEFPGTGFTKGILSFLVLVLLLPGAMAFTVSPLTLSPSQVLNPGDTVNVSFTVYVAEGVAFPSYDDLQMVTGLEDPVWSYSIIVNGVENVRPTKRGLTQTISGFELGYRNQDEVIVKVTIQGKVPAAAAPGTNMLLLKVQELDARSSVLPNSVVRSDHLVGLPTPTPTPAYGSITATSDPAGATVYLDNAIRGITPVTLEAVPNGAHTVLVRLDGYQDSVNSVNVMAGQERVSAQLVPKSATVGPTASGSPGTPAVPGVATPAPVPATNPGTLSVTTNPAGAIVYIDGQMKGITPATIPGLSAGSHSVVLILDGYEDFRTTTEITPGTTSEFITGLSKRKQAPGFGTGVALAALVCGVLVIFRGRRRE